MPVVRRMARMAIRFFHFRAFRSRRERRRMIRLFFTLRIFLTASRNFSVLDPDDPVRHLGNALVVRNHHNGLLKLLAADFEKAEHIQAVLESRFPVGSSARIMAGLEARALAMATLCCWPPESWLGRLSFRSESPRVWMTRSIYFRSTRFPVQLQGKNNIFIYVQHRDQVIGLEDKSRSSGGGRWSEHRFSEKRCPFLPQILCRDVGRSSPPSI